MAKIIFKTSNSGYIYYASSESAANRFADKNGLGSVFVKPGQPTSEDLSSAKKVAPGVWLSAD